MLRLRLLDLFSGIGGFSLGLERSGYFKTVAFCEIEPYCRAVLAKHWKGVPCYADVRELTAAKLAADGIAVDAVCGGFPCQDISTAGKGAGIEGERSGLWREYARLVGELRPRYVVVENVAALLGRGLDRVLGDLAALGYDAEWHCIPASAVGAPHRRDRVWIVAHAASQRRWARRTERDVHQTDGGSFRSVRAEPSRTGPQPQTLAEADDIRSSSQSKRNARSVAKEIGGKEGTREKPSICFAARGPDVADANGAGLEIGCGIGGYLGEELAAIKRSGWWATEPDVGRVASRISAWLDDSRGITLNEQTRALARAQGVTENIARTGCLRAVREYGEIAEAPPRLQRPDAIRDCLQSVSRQITRRRAAGEPYESMHDLWDAISSIAFEETPNLFKSVLERIGQKECEKALGARVSRLKSLGNAVVPQIPELIGRAIGATL